MTRTWTTTTRTAMRREMRTVARALRGWRALAVLALVGAVPLGAQSAGPVEIPLFTQGGRMVIPATAADGTALRFLVSTGSTVTVLSETGAARAAEGGATIGGVPVNMENAVTVSDEDLTVDGTVMDGLVSNNTLYDFDVLFDVPEGRLVLRPIGRSVTWPGVRLSDPVPLRVYHGVVLALDVEIDGTAYPAMLELGATALLANEAVLKENDIREGRVDLTLGSTVLSGLPIELSDNPTIGRFSPNGDGFVIVGAPPALECAVAISWVHRELRTCVR